MTEYEARISKLELQVEQIHAFMAGLRNMLLPPEDVAAGRPIVPEPILKRRKAGAELLNDLLAWSALVENPEQIPHYKVLGRVYLRPDSGDGCGERLIEPYARDKDRAMRSVTIRYRDIPNGALEPLNESAKALHAAWSESIYTEAGESARALAAPTNNAAPELRFSASGVLLTKGNAAQNGGFEKSIPLRQLYRHPTWLADLRAFRAKQRRERRRAKPPIAK